MELLILFVQTFLFVLIVLFLGNKYKSKNIKSLTKKRQKQLAEIDYFRGIPFDNLEEAYWVAKEFGLIEEKSDLIGSFILKWVYENKVKFIKVKNEFDEEEIAIDLSTYFKTNTEFESKIYGLLLAAANSDKILKNDELNNLFKDKQSTIHNFFSSLNSNVKTALINKKLITVTSDSHNYLKTTYSEELLKKASYLRGLKNFLNDFSLMRERESVEIHLWEQYMVYAHLLGITDKIENEFENLYPNLDKIDETKLVNEALKITIQLFTSL